ncbi:MAG: glutathione S-transferase family protein [Oricola sp.]
MHGSPGSRMTRVTWMLEELGEPYELRKARVGTGDLDGLSPSGKGPVLVDGDFVLTDSAAICLYLADKHGDRGFGPRDARERAVMMSWMLWALSEFEQPMWNKFKHRIILPEDQRADVTAWLTAEFARECAVLEKRLAGHDYAMGERFTCVDVVLGHCGNWARGSRFAVASGLVNAYFDRVLGRPAWQRAREREAALKAAE